MENTSAQSTASLRWPIVLALAMVIVTLAVTIGLVARRKKGGGTREHWQDYYDVQTRNASLCPEDNDIDRLLALISNSPSAAAIDARAYLDHCKQVNERLQKLNNLQLRIQTTDCTQNLVEFGNQVNTLEYPHPAVMAKVKTLRAMISERMRACSTDSANRAIDELKSEPRSATVILGALFMVGIAVLVVMIIKKYVGKRGNDASSPSTNT